MSSKSPGRRIAAPWNRAVNEELAALIAKKTLGNPLWGRGAFTRHIVVGFFEPVSYCGRFVGAINTQPMPTLIGVACPTCLRRWNRAMDLRNAEIDRENGAVITRRRAQLVDLYEAEEFVEFRTVWREVVNDNRPLYRALTAELADHHIVVADVLERARVELGEREPFKLRLEKDV